MLRWHVVDTLTGTIVGRLNPHRWELGDPLLTPGVGTITVARPTGTDNTRRLRDLTLPQERWVAVEDDQQRFLWAGPIPREPARAGAEIIIPVQDWRSWFHRAPIRPNTNGTRRHWIKAGWSAQDETKQMTDLMALALDAPGHPRIVVDAPIATGTERDVTGYMLDRKIGELLDDLVAQGAPEWWTYCSRQVLHTPATYTAGPRPGRYDPDTQLVLHVRAGHPERRSRDIPIRLEYRSGTAQAGNISAFDQPEGPDLPTKVWGVGEGDHNSHVFSSAQHPGLAGGTEVLWESVEGPLAGVRTTRAVYDHTRKTLKTARRGTIEVTVAHEKVPLGGVATGDRARIVIDDGWTVIDANAARIVNRTLTGGNKEPTLQRLTIDLDDDGYPDDGATPGEVVGG